MSVETVTNAGRGFATDDPGGNESPSSAEHSGYGPPPTIVRESNFVSDADLLVWLSQKQDGLYGDLRDRIDLSRTRSKLVEDLNLLKGKIDSGELDREEALTEINALKEAYAGTEFEGTLNELFAEPLEALTRPPDEALNIVEPVVLPLPLGGEMTVPVAGMRAAVEEGAAKQTLDQLSKSIESKVDALGRDDQLALIDIQSLTADIREAAQLASNLVASSNQAANSIVGNIAR